MAGYRQARSDSRPDIAGVLIGCAVLDGLFLAGYGAYRLAAWLWSW